MHALASTLGPAWILPFAGLLLTIALAPLILPHAWERRRTQLVAALAWSAPVLVLLAQRAQAGHSEAWPLLGHALHEYACFVVLLGSLYAISGGILLTGDIEARPAVNTAFLAAGVLLSNAIGTTGASMLLIRPMLRTNRERRNTTHIPIFFIFVVSNTSGMLTPLGDPPLFLGYLRGVPFGWTLEHLLGPWVLVNAVLLAAFYALDRRAWRLERPLDRLREHREVQPLRLRGSVNLLLLAGVVLAVLLLSAGPSPSDPRRWPLREAAMVALAALSLRATPAGVREDNGFTWGPIAEVGALFLGIFITMIPATALLEARGHSLGVDRPWEYFWATGLLSSFLDNAPTYLAFASVACGQVPACETAEALGPLAASPAGAPLLAAVAAGAVLMGANSYIGNGPNFMVRGIAVTWGLRMPSFFGYMAWSGLLLLPLYALVTVLFFA